MPYPSFKKLFLRGTLLLCIIHATAPGSYAQQIDSMENEIRIKNLPDKELVDALNILSRDLTFADPAKSARFASEALQKSLKINYAAGQAHGYRILSSIFSSNNNSIIAAEYLERALKIFHEINDSAGIANCYITLGHTFRRARQRQEEITYHKKAFDIFSRIGTPNRIAVSAHNLGESYFLAGEFDKSRRLTEYAIHLNDSLHNLSVLSNCYKVMGKLEVADGNLKEGERYFTKALDISGQLGDNSQKIAAIESLIGLADIHERAGKIKEQVSFLLQAAAFSKKYLLADYLEDIYSNLIKSNAGQKEQVLKYSNEYNAVADTVAAQVLKNRIELNRYGAEVYEYLESETRNLEKEYILQEQRIKNKNFFLAISIVSGLLFAVMSIVLFRLVRKEKRSQQEIKNKTEQLRELAAHLQNVREQERTTIANEIHDELGQPLTVIKMDMSWLKERLAGSGGEAAAKRTEELGLILDNAVKAVRRISSSLRPGMLDDIGLPVAINWELSEFEKRHAVKTSFEFEASDVLLTLPDQVKTGLFRIFQEALLNIGQHAHAKNIMVKLFSPNAEAVLLIWDDGIGLGSGISNSKRDLGFLGMKERCYMLNGNFDVQNSPGRGTTITVKVPLT